MREVVILLFMLLGMTPTSAQTTEQTTVPELLLPCVLELEQGFADPQVNLTNFLDKRIVYGLLGDDGTSTTVTRDNALPLIDQFVQTIDRETVRFTDYELYGIIYGTYASPTLASSPRQFMLDITLLSCSILDISVREKLLFVSIFE